MSGLVADRCALVFACSDGIGEAVAVQLEEDGAKAIVCGETGDLRHDGMPTKVGQAFDEAAAQLGKVDIVVNAVTQWWVGLPEEAGDEIVTDLSQWNLAFANAVTRETLSRIQGPGSLLSISHVWATGTSPELGLAGATKAVLGPLTKAAALRGAPRGLRANLLLLGMVNTPKHREIAEQRLKVLEQDGDSWEKATSHIAMGRAALPKEVAMAASFLSSDRSLAITGVTVLCDGGLLYA